MKQADRQQFLINDLLQDALLVARETVNNLPVLKAIEVARELKLGAEIEVRTRLRSESMQRHGVAVWLYKQNGESEKLSSANMD